MAFEDLIQPLTLFLIWYIIPGYLFLAIFIPLSKGFQPTLKFSWKKIKNFDKIIFSIIISTIIYYLYFYFKNKGIEDILKISQNDLVVVIGISLSFAISLAFALSLLIFLINDYIRPFFYIFYLIIKRFLKKYVLKKRLNLSFFDDFYQSGVRRMGIAYDLLLVNIEEAYQTDSQVSLRLKSTEETKSGKIISIKRDLLEFELDVGNRKITNIRVDDINYMTYQEDEKKLKKYEINKIKKRTWWIIILSSIISLLLLRFVPYLIFIPILFLVLKFCIIDKWEILFSI